MTRIRTVSAAALFVLVPFASAFAQTAPSQRGAAVQGPQQPVRQTAGQEPVREPQGPALPFPQTQSQTQPALPQSQPQTRPLAEAIGPLAPQGPQQPSWIPLDPGHEKWVNQVLQYWETRSSKIKALTCQFRKWEYDPVFGPKEADGRTPNFKAPLTIAEGEIKYAAPDKGKFQVTKLSRYAGPPTMPGGDPQYAVQDASFSEHWVSDGKSVFEYDSRNKRLIQRELPPEMQGKAIADGPLPFLFGARAETIRARYWVRGLPQGGKGKYWLEAVPKSRQDAQNFKAVTIVLDEKTYLPELLEVLAPNYDSKTNPARTTYQFTQHDVVDDNLDYQELLKKLNPFKTAFYAPKLPSGWTRITQRPDGSTVVPGVPGAQGVPGALEATKKPTPPRSGLPR
jgi:TIGR03009 family protein